MARRRTAASELKKYGIYQETVEKIEAVLVKHRPDVADDVPHLLKIVRVKDTRSLTRAGHYSPSKMEIAISALEFPSYIKQNTLLHEISHLVAHQCYGKKIRPHGWEWRKVAVALGVTVRTTAERDPDIMKALKERRAKHEKVVARCVDCGIEFKQMRRTKKDWTQRRHVDCPGGYGSIKNVR